MNRLLNYFQSNRLVEKEYNQHELSFDKPLPLGLKGTLFRNGNGRFEHLGVRYDHLFDGDGMLAKFVFKDGKVYYSNRHVRTDELEKEEQAGKMLYRSFGTNIPGGFSKNLMKTRFKNASNTSVIWHGGKLLSLWEGGLPHEIDPETLETKGRYHYNKKLLNPYTKLDQMIFPEMAFSAHPKIHPDTGELYNFGTIAGLKNRLMQYRVQPDGTMDQVKGLEMPGVVFTHDFVLTESKKKVFFFTPVSFGLFKMFVGLDTPVGSMQVRKGQPTTILLLDEHNKKTEFKTDFGFIFHFANGFDLEDGRVVVDGFMMPDFPGAEVNKKLFEGNDDATPAGILTRFILNPTTGEVERFPLSDRAGEMPALHPEKKSRVYEYVWCLGLPKEADYKLLDGLQKVNVKTGKIDLTSFHPHLPGEPIFIPKPGTTQEDEGWISILIFNTESLTTWLYILDAKDLKEICKAQLPHNIPLGFHGLFVKELY
ncbi:MAG: carotenoid oxygenase family protein [Bacteroidota bacterium]